MTEELSFEEAMAQLEDIVKKLDQDTLSLDDSIKAYEEGMKLSQYCQKKLTQARLTIKEVSEQGIETNFEDDNA